MSPRRSVARCALVLLIALMAAGTQSACSIVSPWPTLELIKAAGGGASMAIASYGSQASDTVYHFHAMAPSVCIEHNPDAQVADILPALQLELKAHQVDSRVYENGTPTSLCDRWLTYSAYVDWDIPLFGDRYTPYLRSAALTLRHSTGQVLSSSRYELAGWLPRGKWATTRQKLAPVVTALLTGFEN